MIDTLWGQGLLRGYDLGSTVINIMLLSGTVLNDQASPTSGGARLQAVRVSYQAGIPGDEEADSLHGLAARFGVARGPVREALRALALAGLLDSQPGRGTFVCKPLPTTPPDEPLAQVFSDQARALRHTHLLRITDQERRGHGTVTCTYQGQTKSASPTFTII